MKRLAGDDEIGGDFGRVVSSAVAAMLVNFGNAFNKRSPASRMSRLGSTPKTGFPFARNNSVSLPVPEPMSAMTDCGLQSAFGF